MHSPSILMIHIRLEDCRRFRLAKSKSCLRRKIVQNYNDSYFSLMKNIMLNNFVHCECDIVNTRLPCCDVKNHDVQESVLKIIFYAFKRSIGR